MSIQVEKITPPITLGEGPHWDPDTNTLYFIDHKDATVHSYKPDSGKYNTATICNGEYRPTFIIPVEGQSGQFVISNSHDICVMSWDGVSPDIEAPKTIASCEPKDNPTRLNDGKVDPAGRLWTGTMGFEIEGKLGEFVEEKGGLYSITGNNSAGYKANKHLGKITLSNGLAWSLDHKTFFYIDSMKYRVSAYDYDIKSGSISNQRTVIDFKQKQIPGIPDGMTVDSEGKLVVAVFAGGCVLRIDPDSGEVLSKIQIPVPQVTSIAFGGDNFDELYVTTANIYATPESLQMFPDAGSVYKLTNLGFKGVKANKVEL